MTRLVGHPEKSSFQHLVARAETSLQACFSYTLRDCGISRAMLDDQKKCSAAQGVMNAYKVHSPFFGFLGQPLCFKSDAGRYRKPVEAEWQL